MFPKSLTMKLLEDLVHAAEINQEGKTADYIPELANVNQDLTAIAVQPLGEPSLSYANNVLHPVTLQSTAKMIPLIGLLEEFGVEQLFKWVKVEPSGDDFASITRLEQFGPKPSNPMLNAGAISLCSRIPGVGEQQFRWLEHWVQKLFNQRLNINPLVLASEKRTGNRNEK
jgi:glutaminase